jgi:hypothetical protein
MSDVAHDMLIPDEMATIHAAMIDRFCWFEHVGRFDRYQSYRTGGIQPRDPYRDDEAPELPEQPVGTISRRVVCLRPIDTFNSIPNRGDRQFRMAIRNNDLPPTIGLDRSHSSTMNKAADLRRAHPNWTNSEIFIEVTHLLGSFVSFDHVCFF